MLIRSTADACLVFLKNGLTLELVYDQGPRGGRERASEESLEGEEFGTPPRASHGVWMFHEEVLCEIRAGQA